jgi:hypothetical protein
MIILVINLPSFDILFILFQLKIGQVFLPDPVYLIYSLAQHYLQGFWVIIFGPFAKSS